MSEPSRDLSVQELERRLIDLEVRAAFQTQTIEALDEVVRTFAARVETLERNLAELANSGSPEEAWAVPGGKDGEAP
ncbi:MAG: SlyX family protein [Nannocystis sp.]|nr:SlyX family protein [Nannocystis sp.]MBA3549770.1 SlyX family protein [Nannocystis sp.]